jgi:hypothetical protein
VISAIIFADAISTVLCCNHDECCIKQLQCQSIPQQTRTILTVSVACSAARQGVFVFPPAARNLDHAVPHYIIVKNSPDRD